MTSTEHETLSKELCLKCIYWRFPTAKFETQIDKYLLDFTIYISVNICKYGMVWNITNEEIVLLLYYLFWQDAHLGINFTPPSLRTVV